MSTKQNLAAKLEDLAIFKVFAAEKKVPASIIQANDEELQIFKDKGYIPTQWDK